MKVRVRCEVRYRELGEIRRRLEANVDVLDIRAVSAATWKGEVWVPLSYTVYDDRKGRRAFTAARLMIPTGRAFEVFPADDTAAAGEQDDLFGVEG